MAAKITEKVYVGLPPAANGIDDGRWWPWRVEHCGVSLSFRTEAEADEYIRKHSTPVGICSGL